MIGEVGRAKFLNGKLTAIVRQNISEVSVSGLEKVSFADKVGGGKKEESGAITISSEVDRVYHVDPSQEIVVAEKQKPRLEFTRDMLPDVVVWNPWIEKSKTMSDLAPEDAYKRFICVETGSVSWNTLEAGDTWEGGQRIKAV